MLKFKIMRKSSVLMIFIYTISNFTNILHSEITIIARRVEVLIKFVPKKATNWYINQTKINKRAHKISTNSII